MSVNEPPERSAIDVWVGAGKAGAKLQVSHGFLEWLSPERAARTKIFAGAAEGISKKLAAGDFDLSKAESATLAVLLPREFQRFEAIVDVAARADSQTDEVRRQMQALPSGEEQATTQTWKDRLWADAEEVTDEDVRSLYGRILAGERIRPGSFSLQTIGVLRYLEMATAEHFRAFVNLVIWPNYIASARDVFLEAAGLGFAEFSRIKEAGLIGSGRVQRIVPRLQDGYCYVLMEGRMFRGKPTPTLMHPGTFDLSVRPDRTGVDVAMFEGYQLTQAGVELATLVRRESTESHHRAVGRELREGLESIEWAKLQPGVLNGAAQEIVANPEVLAWEPLP